MAGRQWANHRYVQKIGNRYIYPEDLQNGNVRALKPNTLNNTTSNTGTAQQQSTPRVTASFRKSARTYSTSGSERVNNSYNKYSNETMNSPAMAAASNTGRTHVERLIPSSVKIKGNTTAYLETQKHKKPITKMNKVKTAPMPASVKSQINSSIANSYKMNPVKPAASKSTEPEVMVNTKGTKMNTLQKTVHASSNTTASIQQQKGMAAAAALPQKENVKKSNTKSAKEMAEETKKAEYEKALEAGRKKYAKGLKGVVRR